MRKLCYHLEARDGSRAAALDASKLSGFFRLGLRERRARIAELVGLDPKQLEALSAEGGLTDEQANRMVENAVGVMGVPLGVCVNVEVDDKAYFVPMAVEEPSVIAAASFGAKLLRAGGGLRSWASEPHMIGQLQLLDVPDAAAARQAVSDAERELLERANAHHERLVAAGGGAVGIEVRWLESLPEDDVGAMMVVHLIVDVRDAMGANAVNAMCEALAPRVAELTGARVGLRILSNLTDRRRVIVRGRVPIDALEGRGVSDPRRLARGIAEASCFAERDPYRAATHNKGVMNGIDAALLALGQDWRAVEAGAHAFAARSGRYTALATWRVEQGALVGSLEIPMAVGIVGGVARSHPTARATRAIAGIESADELARVVAAVGLAQNLSALRALASEGIQRGHMRLHARNVAVEAGASGDDVDTIAERLATRGAINLDAARAVLRDLRRERQTATTFPAHYPHEQGSLVVRFEALREEYWPAMQQLIERVMADSTRADSRLVELSSYQLKTGGRRVRALLPLLVADALEASREALLPFGCACEVLHNATLVHDDLLDRDPIRRGSPTIWGRWGSADAVNAGSALLLYAPVLLQHLQFPPNRRDSVARRLIRSALAIIDSQEQELAVDAAAPSMTAFLATVADKRSSMFALPLAGAAELLDADPAIVSALEEAGRQLGVMFQLTEEAVELRRDADLPEFLTNGKRSIALVHAMTELDATAAARLLSIVDRDPEQSGDNPMQLVSSQDALDFLLREASRTKARVLAIAESLTIDALAELVRALCESFASPLDSMRPPAP